MSPFSFCNTIVFCVNLSGALLLIVALGVPYVPVTSMPALSTLSLGVPVLVALHGAFVLYWILVRRWYFLLSTAVLVLWYVVLGPFYQISVPQVLEKEYGESWSVLSFNVRGFNKYRWIDNPEIEREIVSLIQTKNPDVLCLQECSSLKETLFREFPYRYKTPAHTGRVLQVVFSKYPILNGGSLDFPETSNNAVYADIAFKNDTVRLYNIHLQSFHIVPEMNTFTEEHSSKLFARFRAVMLKQYEQANLIRKHMEKSQHTKVIVGDFNNTQYSNVYRIIKGAMNDSFFEKGSGFGRTYALWSVPLRIDYILADPALEILSHENFTQKLSDHYPVMATLRTIPVPEAP